MLDGHFTAWQPGICHCIPRDGHRGAGEARGKDSEGACPRLQCGLLQGGALSPGQQVQALRGVPALLESCFCAGSAVVGSPGLWVCEYVGPQHIRLFCQ